MKIESQIHGGCDMDLRTLLASDHRQTLEFFFIGLKDVSPEEVDRKELLYNASVLAHYAQVSTVATTEFPTPKTLSSVFDNFVGEVPLPDPSLLETAGAHCLLMAGFFEDQMRGKHNIRWFASLGGSFFFRAAKLETDRNRSFLFWKMSSGFEPWRQRYAKLSRELRDTPYLLNLPTLPRLH